MPLSAGDKLGPYELAEMIGKGGMGEVYRAHDPRLRRDVAIKVSAQQFSERFEREARAVAALNHPNICTLFDVGPNYLVMELVEGPTLAERIKEGAMPLEEAMVVARQITAALEAAHEKGITHRDLKPGNVKIKPDGLVKVLDFGLAKVAPTATSSGVGDESPTLSMVSMAATKAGVILGTAAYMSPEQARGKTDIDKRADVWAFGVVLYEMLTAERLFRGEDLTEVLASVVKEQPDVSGAPREVRRLIVRCLAKDPAKRLRDIGDVWELLESGTESPAQAESLPHTSKLPWVAAAVLGVGVVAFAALWLNPAPQEFQAVQFSISEPPETNFTNTIGAMAPSPDGRFIVFGATAPGGGNTPRLWLRPLNSQEARLLPGTEGGNFPFWSPDSKSLAFRSQTDGKLKRIEITGGAPLVLSDVTESAVTTTGTWNHNGTILYGGPGGLHRVPASGGVAILITKVNAERKETGHGYPQFLPDGKRFLYFVASGDSNVQGVYAASLDQPEQATQILRTGNKAVYSPPRGDAPGYLLWMQDQTLLAQRFDPDKLQVEGDPASVAQEVTLNSNDPVRAAYWADGGVLVYRSGEAALAKAPVIWMSADGKPLGDALPADSVGPFKLSPDGQRLAIARRVGLAAFDIWLWEFARGGVFTRLTFDEGRDNVPIWSPDGRQVAFNSDREGSIFQIYRKDASGAGQEERLTEGPNWKAPLDWSRDGKYLLYRERAPKTDQDVWALPLEGDRKPIPIAQTPFVENTGQISPDGKWVAYSSNESGRGEVYVRASPWAEGAAGGRWQVSNDGGAEPKWSADGRRIFYETGDGKIIAATVRTGSAGFQTDTPRELFKAGHDAGQLHSFDVTGDGQKFVLLMPAGGAQGGAPLTVIANWQAALRK